MVAELSVAQASAAMMLHGGRFPEAMACATAEASGQIVFFPGWDALDAMPAEDLKRWLMANRNGHGMNYVATVSASAPTHRGHGTLLPQAAAQVPRHAGDRAVAEADGQAEPEEFSPPSAAHPGNSAS